MNDIDPASEIFNKVEGAAETHEAGRRTEKTRCVQERTTRTDTPADIGDRTQVWSATGMTVPAGIS